MDHIEGRVFKDPSLPGMSANERQDIYQALCEVLCKIHSVDVSKAGLQEYGKHGEYYTCMYKGIGGHYMLKKALKLKGTKAKSKGIETNTLMAFL